MKRRMKKLFSVIGMTFILYAAMDAEVSFGQEQSGSEESVQYQWALTDDGTIAYNFYKGKWIENGNSEVTMEMDVISEFNISFYISIDNEQWLVPVKLINSCIVISSLGAEPYDGIIGYAMYYLDGVIRFSLTDYCAPIWNTLCTEGGKMQLEIVTDLGAAQGRESELATFSFVLDQSAAPFNEIANQLQ